MGNPRHVRAHELEILVARELRKAGLELSPPSTVGRRALSAGDETEFAVELATVIIHRGVARDALIECRNERSPTALEPVRALAERLTPAPSPNPATAGAPARPRLGMMFSTSGYDVAAVREAVSSGIAVFAITDGQEAFRRSQWAMGAQTPAWVPEYMAELVELDPAGSLRHRLLSASWGRDVELGA